MNKVDSRNRFNMAISGEQYLADLNAFSIMYNSLDRPGYENKMILFLEEFFLQMYPQERIRLIGIYIRQMNENGNSKLAHEAVRIYLEATHIIASLGQRSFNLPLLYESYNSLMRIGQLADESASTLLQRQLGVIDQKPVLCISDTENSGKVVVNQGFRPYLDDCFEVVTDSFSANYFRRMSQFSPYSAFFYKLSNTQYGQVGNFFFDSYPALIEKNINPYPFHLKDVTRDKAMKFLQSYGLKADDDFVVMHLREQGYFDRFQHVYRDVDSNEYVAAVQYLLDQGLKVVRIGHEKMKPMLEHPGFIDLTKTSRPDEVDIFLCGKAKFYFGSASGPYSVSHNFGVPCCVTNVIDYGGVRPNNFVQYLQFSDKKNKSILSFSDFDRLGLKSVFSAKVFQDRELKPLFPSSIQNLKLVQEMLDYLQNGSIFRQNADYESKKVEHKIFGGLCSESLSLLDKSSVVEFSYDASSRI